MLGLFETEQTSDIVGISSRILWRHQTSSPVVSLVDGFVRERPTSRMIFTVTIMDLLHHAPGFLTRSGKQMTLARSRFSANKP